MALEGLGLFPLFGSHLYPFAVASNSTVISNTMRWQITIGLIYMELWRQCEHTSTEKGISNLIDEFIQDFFDRFMEPMSGESLGVHK